MPRWLIFGRERGIGRRGLTEPVAVFAGPLTIKVVLLPPRDPESEGAVERRNRFFETSSFVHLGAHFASSAGFNDPFSR
ncbi:hypothetical protein N864_23610 [Intrasporangium chromatireducens Q5-1]|uniref:Uncharacterized protein n=1 Tax=Intrasporangium chromatireducens Q5-1 TaxID=584657 RepID=W9GNR4_9MICO|nr:hypothetical protein [Intrasporangium chromatireducens]EWT07770.1 hypothetical protein N864_23610 [Intrasporangium chromatireducens Q5-1]